MNTTLPKKRTLSADEAERRKQKTALVKAEILLVNDVDDSGNLRGI